MPPVDRVTFLFDREHYVSALEVIVECRCGAVFSGDTEEQAMRDYEIHVDDESASHSD
jgi:hypothetical protein